MKALSVCLWGHNCCWYLAKCWCEELFLIRVCLSLQTSFGSPPSLSPSSVSPSSTHPWDINFEWKRNHLFNYRQGWLRRVPIWEYRAETSPCASFITIYCGSPTGKQSALSMISSLLSYLPPCCIQIYIVLRCVYKPAGLDWSGAAAGGVVWFSVIPAQFQHEMHEWRPGPTVSPPSFRQRGEKRAPPGSPAAS